MAGSLIDRVASLFGRTKSTPSAAPTEPVVSEEPRRRS